MDAPGKIRDAAITLLARREHSHRELSRKLCSKGFDPHECEAALRQLEDEGLLSDRRYAEAYVRMRANRGYGPERIRHELREKGVASALAGEEMDRAGTDWFELAVEVRRKRFGDSPPEDFAERARQMRFLQYRGFSHEQIGFAVSEMD